MDDRCASDLKSGGSAKQEGETDFIRFFPYGVAIRPLKGGRVA